MLHIHVQWYYISQTLYFNVFFLLIFHWREDDISEVQFVHTCHSASVSTIAIFVLFNNGHCCIPGVQNLLCITHLKNKLRLANKIS